MAALVAWLSFGAVLVIVTGQITSPCCQNDHVLDVERGLCVGSPSKLDSTYSEASGWSEPLIKCTDEFEWANYTTKEDVTNASSLVEPVFNQTLIAGQFCLHPARQADGDLSRSNETLVIFCRRTLTLNKCCPAGYSVNRTSIGGPCVQHKSEFNFSAVMMPSGWPFRVQDNVSFTCEHDYNIYAPKVFVDNAFKVNASGQLIVRAAIYQVLRYPSGSYCVDNAVDSQGNQEPLAVTCLTGRMYLLRWLLWGIYPYLHFVSAFFLLLTMIVYSVFPTLRDNIQGYSMICFLICMIIVQAEYGVILSLPLEPHTWCFSKVWISTYFRYASSTWITVMGFNIWTQLSRGPKPLNRLELLTRFGWCSLYAWGVALVLQIAVVGYVEHVRKGRVIRLCWYGNPIVSHMLSTPNVVLVTLNLIFFIPSAIRVYGSLRFLRKSVSAVSLSKLEKQRITTIFRFFLLMQFYTIPRIVHMVVDTDNASPELLIFSISLYMLIGPAMFYFFVCKTEVFKLIAQMAASFKNKTTQSVISSRISTASTRFWRSRSYETSLSPPTTPTASSVEPVKFYLTGEENPAFTPELPATPTRKAVTMAAGI